MLNALTKIVTVKNVGTALTVLGFSIKLAGELMTKTELNKALQKKIDKAVAEKVAEQLAEIAANAAVEKA